MQKNWKFFWWDWQITHGTHRFQFWMPEFSIVTAGQPKGLVLAAQQQKESFSIKALQAYGPPIWY